MKDDAVTDTHEGPSSSPRPRSKVERRQPFDVALGARIRALRNAAGMSQTALGQAIGVSFQQVQKYELGMDRVSASTLFGLAAALNVPPGSLYEGCAHVPTMPTRSGPDGAVAVKAAVIFQQIGDPGVKRRLVELAKMLGEDAGGGKA